MLNKEERRAQYKQGMYKLITFAIMIFISNIFFIAYENNICQAQHIIIPAMLYFAIFFMISFSWLIQHARKNLLVYLLRVLMHFTLISTLVLDYFMLKGALSLFYFHCAGIALWCALQLMQTISFREYFFRDLLTLIASILTSSLSVFVGLHSYHIFDISIEHTLWPLWISVIVMSLLSVVSASILLGGLVMACMGTK